MTQKLRPLTSSQCRMARAALCWSVNDLVERSGVAGSTITRLENNQGRSNNATLIVLRNTFEEAGIEFIGDQGVMAPEEA